jgi:disulfide bond formation protein DsbB
MTLDQFSVLVSIGLFALSGVILFSFLSYLLVPRARASILCWRYSTYVAMIGLISLGSVVGALIYQLAYLTPVCELCWWQRIFLFPISIVAAVAVWRGAREAHVTTAILSAFGLFYSAYHYYYHFQGLVLGNVLSLPCSSGGLLPACTESPILTFGFVTIPLMGILVFSSMLILAFFAHRKAASERAAAAL